MDGRSPPRGETHRVQIAEESSDTRWKGVAPLRASYRAGRASTHPRPRLLDGELRPSPIPSGRSTGGSPEGEAPAPLARARAGPGRERPPPTRFAVQSRRWHVPRTPGGGARPTGTTAPERRSRPEEARLSREFHSRREERTFPGEWPPRQTLHEMHQILPPYPPHHPNISRDPAAIDP